MTNLRSIRFVLASLSAMLVAMTFALPGQAAAVVFTTIGTGICAGDATCIANNGINQNYDPLPGDTFSPFNSEMVASQFTPSGNFQLSDVQVVLQFLSALGGVNSANIYLTADSAGQPGIVLESWLNKSVENFQNTQLNADVFNSVLNPTLNSGTKYWFVVGPGNANADLGLNPSWTVAATAATGLANFTPVAGIPTLAGPWVSDGPSLMAAFQIDGTAVVGTPTPEPGAWVLVGTGLVGCWVLMRRKTRLG
jgi:hypothetical protein